MAPARYLYRAKTSFFLKMPQLPSAVRRFGRFLALGALMLATLVAPSHADEVELKIPIISGQRHLYYVGLLEAALRAAGHTPKIVIVSKVPQSRLWNEVERGGITLFWGLPNTEREARYIGVGRDLTAGMIGQRVLLVPIAQQGVYATVKSVDDLRATGKVAGLAKGWVDVGIWNQSRLPVFIKEGEWTELFKMVADGQPGVDYLSRSVLEAETEMGENGAGLAIEPKLILKYDLDMRFYLSRHNAALQPVLESALDKAERSGLIKKYSRNYYQKLTRSLHLKERRVITLPLPEPAA
jgi:hypothetical protein